MSNAISPFAGLASLTMAAVPLLAVVAAIATQIVTVL